MCAGSGCCCHLDTYNATYIQDLLFKTTSILTLGNPWGASAPELKLLAVQWPCVPKLCTEQLVPVTQCDGDLASLF